MIKTLTKVSLMSAMLAASGLALACEGAGPMTHIGQVTAVDDGSGSFTIMDMQSRSHITFKANDKILTGLKDAAGLVKVNYQKNDGGDLTAVGVTF